MRASRGMGDINPSKMPTGVKKARRDDTDFTQYAAGGKVAARKKKKSKPSGFPAINPFKGQA
jgi:hypothetical protein